MFCSSSSRVLSLYSLRETKRERENLRDKRAHFRALAPKSETQHARRRRRRRRRREKKKREKKPAFSLSISLHGKKNVLSPHGHGQLLGVDRARAVGVEEVKGLAVEAQFFICGGGGGGVGGG